MFKNRKITVIAVALLLAVCLTGGTMAALAASTNTKGNGEIDEQEDAALTAEKQNKKDEIALDENGNPAAPGGRGSRIQTKEPLEIAADLGIDTAGMTTGDEIRDAIRAYKEVKVNENINDPKAAGNGCIDEQEDAALTAEKQSKKSEIALDENGNPAAPGGRGSKIR
ncbi:MAG: hypothetical protein FWD23_09675 [Oscillospiraceae bacterium]|nr:hypothetical protein [Oscillospiraceae bacterium]